MNAVNAANDDVVGRVDDGMHPPRKRDGDEQKWLYKEGEELEICQSWPSSCGVRISL